MKKEILKPSAEVASLSLGKSLNYQDTKAVLNQAVADLSVAHSILH